MVLALKVMKVRVMVHYVDEDGYLSGAIRCHFHA